MINLLPPEHQSSIRAGRIKRFVITFGTLFAFTIFANILLLAPLWLSLALQRNELTRELDSIRKSSIFAQVTDIEAAIKTLNTEIRLFRTKEKERFDITPEFRAVIDSRPAGITIDSFIFERAQKTRPARISISGNALRRSTLIRFRETLEKNPLFSRIQSPISNLLKEVDIQYSFILELDKKANAS
ncbi:hypothetical protein IIA95_00650 [Patescibacteria group bacterium]|nr:hypothetical protein [Patescibacteria group bacterium]